MNHSQLFEELVLELQNLINSHNEYELIKSSRVLRQLLLDGDALLHLVNRELRASPQFFVRKAPEQGAKQDFFHPEVYVAQADEPKIELDLQKFLSHVIGQNAGRQITVRQVIKFGAIVLGGVHFKGDRNGVRAFC